MLKTPEHALRIPLKVFQAVPEEKKRLGLIVFLITLVHVVFFITVEVHYPESKPSSNRRTEIFLSSPNLMGSDSWKSTSFWNQMRDPSIILHQELLPTPKQRIDPVFENSTHSNLPLLVIGSDSEIFRSGIAPLENRAQEKMIPTPTSFAYSNETLKFERSTRIVLSKNLENRKKSMPANLPQPTVNLLNEAGVSLVKVEVNADGFVTHVMIEESSGSPAVDLLALHTARKIIFQPASGTPSEWGFVSIYWAFSSPTPSKESP